MLITNPPLHAHSLIHPCQSFPTISQQAVQKKVVGAALLPKNPVSKGGCSIKIQRTQVHGTHRNGCSPVRIATHGAMCVSGDCSLSSMNSTEAEVRHLHLKIIHREIWHHRFFDCCPSSGLERAPNMPSSDSRIAAIHGRQGDRKGWENRFAQCCQLLLV